MDYGAYLTQKMGPGTGLEGQVKKNPKQNLAEATDGASLDEYRASENDLKQPDDHKEQASG